MKIVNINNSNEINKVNYFSNEVVTYAFKGVEIENLFFTPKNASFTFEKCTIGRLAGNVDVFTIKDCEVNIIDENASVNEIIGNSYIKNIDRDSRVISITDRVIVESIGGNSKINNVLGMVKIEKMIENSSIKCIHGIAKIGKMEQGARIELACENAIIKSMIENSSIEKMIDYSTVNFMGGNAIIERMSDFSRVLNMENGKIGLMKGDSRVVDFNKGEIIDIKQYAIATNKRGEYMFNFQERIDLKYKPIKI